MSDNLLEAAVRFAGTVDGGLAALHELVRQKFISEKIAKTPTLVAAKAAYSALGENEFRRSIVTLPPSKAVALLKKIDKHSPEIATLPASGIQSRIIALSAGQATPAAPAPARPRPSLVAEPLPDVRALYNQGGMPAVASSIQGLKLAGLRKIVSEQALKCSDAKPDTAAGLRKYIQQSVKEELGSRGDPIGALAAMSDESDL